MPTFEPGTVVKVPFPYTDRDTRQRRPALVVSSTTFQTEHALIWVVMITSAENRGWRGDVDINDLGQAGLPVASIIRPAKLATLEARDATALGRVSKSVLNKAQGYITKSLG